MNNIEYLANGDFDDSSNRGWSGSGWYFWDEADGQYCYGPYNTKEIAEQKMKEYGKNMT